MPTSNGYIGSAAVVTKPASFAGGNQSAADLRAFCQSMVTGGTAPGIWSLNAVYDQIRASNWINTFPSNVNPTAGGTLTINSVALGSYDYTIKYGDQTVSSFTNSDWFTTTADTRSAIIYVRGNLTINSGVIFQPSNRKLFTVIYVDGNLTVDGTITMSARGANHSATTKGAIKLVPSGTYSGVTDPQVPADGGAGAAATARTSGTFNGANGTAGTAGGTGGGAEGGNRENSGTGTMTAGSGVAGTSFSGGGGGGGIWGNGIFGNGTAGSATTNGGAGGNGAIPNIGTNNPSAFGGAGNSGGTAAGPLAGSQTANDGTGGVLIIYVKGTLSGSGTVAANGVTGGGYTGADTKGRSGGGGSGGGSVTIFYNTDSSSISPAANGGSGGTGGGDCSSGTCAGGDGGAGGAGTARKLAM